MKTYATLAPILMMLAGCEKAPTNEQQGAAKDGVLTQIKKTVSRGPADGPLGIAKGEALSDLDKPKEEGPGLYTLGSVPSPYPNVEMYQVVNTEGHGTCKIILVSNDLTPDAYGLETKSTVDGVADDLSTRYGKPTDSYDFLSPGSIWSDPKDWYDGIRQNERHYAHTWTRRDGADQKVWRGVESILLEVKSNGPNPYWRIVYEFDNFGSCQNDMKQSKAKSL